MILKLPSIIWQKNLCFLMTKFAAVWIQPAKSYYEAHPHLIPLMSHFKGRPHFAKHFSFTGLLSQELQMANFEIVSFIFLPRYHFQLFILFFIDLFFDCFFCFHHQYFDRS